MLKIKKSDFDAHQLMCERVFLPLHRQIASGRTFDRPWDPSAMGYAIERHKAPMSPLDVAGWIGSVLLVAAVGIVIYAPGVWECFGQLGAKA